MDTNFEQKVRERAYEIWVSEGMAHGMAHEHWLMAEQVVVHEAKAHSPDVPMAAKAAAGKKAAPKRAATKKAAKTNKPH